MPEYTIFNNINYRNDGYSFCGKCGQASSTIINDRCIYCDVVSTEEARELTTLLYNRCIIDKNNLDEVVKTISALKLKPKLEPLGQLNLFKD